MVLELHKSCAWGHVAGLSIIQLLLNVLHGPAENDPRRLRYPLWPLPSEPSGLADVVLRLFKSSGLSASCVNVCAPFMYRNDSPAKISYK